MTAPLALVSGITGGVGLVVAKQLWAQGYSILGIGRTPAKVLAVGQWFTAQPEQEQTCWLFATDLRDRDDEVFQQMHTVLTAYGGEIRLLAVCHGDDATHGPSQERIAVALTKRVFEVDVLGALRLCQLVHPFFCANGGGSIILVSSMHAKATYPERTHYAVAKSAMGGLTRALAVEWGTDNICVNMIVPWQIAGERTRTIAVQEGPDTMAQYYQRSPLRYIVDPLDIAKTVLWLANCESITGSEIIIDCGVSASMWHRPFKG